MSMFVHYDYQWKIQVANERSAIWWDVSVNGNPKFIFEKDYVCVLGQQKMATGLIRVCIIDEKMDPEIAQPGL